MIFWVMLIMLFVVVQTLDYKIGPTEYNNRFSFNKTLDEKMAYFPDTKVSWLKFYMNLALPIMLLSFLSDMYKSYQTHSATSTQFIIPLILFLASALNLALFRSIDSVSYITNIVVTSLCVFNICLNFYSYGIVGAGVWILIFYANTYYFYQKRELFFSTEKQLKLKYELE